MTPFYKAEQSEDEQPEDEKSLDLNTVKFDSNDSKEERERKMDLLRAEGDRLAAKSRRLLQEMISESEPGELHVESKQPGEPNVESERPKSRKKVLSCPQCGHEMVRRTGTFGAFYGCSRFPECKGRRSVAASGPVNVEKMRKKMEIVTDFVEKMGSINEARRYLTALETILGDSDED